MFVLLSLFVIFQIVRSQNLTLNFDDVFTRPDSLVALPRPYQGFICKRINTPLTGYSDDSCVVFNVTNFQITNPTYNVYDNTNVSPPNTLLTTAESLSLSYLNRGFFRPVKLTMTSIFIHNMGVSLKGFKNGRLTENLNVTLPISTPTEVNMVWGNIDNIIISCLDYSFNTCAHIVYDSFNFAT
jgi:hypothetical protein